MDWRKVVDYLQAEVRAGAVGVPISPSQLAMALAAGIGANREPRPITYSYDDKGSIVLPEGPPFDGNDVLIELAKGWVQARWEPESTYETADGKETVGFCWVCLDDSYGQEELDDAKRWMSLPEPA